MIILMIVYDVLYVVVVYNIVVDNIEPTSYPKIDLIAKYANIIIK